MKVTYEVNLPDDQGDYQLLVIKDDMYSALTDLQDLVRSINKGWRVFEQEAIMRDLEEIICQSHISQVI